MSPTPCLMVQRSKGQERRGRAARMTRLRHGSTKLKAHGKCNAHTQVAGELAEDLRLTAHPKLLRPGSLSDAAGIEELKVRKERAPAATSRGDEETSEAVTWSHQSASTKL